LFSIIPMSDAVCDDESVIDYVDNPPKCAYYTRKI
jgi:hypothetical protein